ncbi:MAG TPA: helix-turn-helix domain-containing protein [Edaphobacter sp.]|jgi:AcrR family transcriptional regulator|nr:helix-turn-helix domain-containing protein [Edaphobacter sp.]
MARLRSAEKRKAILDAAVEEFAQAGLGAPTAKIARRAEVAEGTLFTYFANKDELLNELYLELKAEVYQRVNTHFPATAGLRERAWHVWSTYLGWALEFPERRKVSAQLNLSDVVSAETRKKAAVGRENIDSALAELGERSVVRELPAGFAAATMAAMQEATMEFAAKHPKQRKALIEKAFEVYWKIFQ